MINFINKLIDTEGIKSNSRLSLSGVDWRYIMTPIKDQGQCGSCYAESSIATYEAMWTIHTGRKHNFSVQQAMDCSKKQGNEGCNGGWMHAVFDWIKVNKGVLLDSQDPYTAMTANCSTNLTQTQIAFIDDWIYVKPSQQDIISLTTCRTVLQLIVFGPKFQLGFRVVDNFLLINNSPSLKYPDIGSKTCCHGLVASGLRIIKGVLFFKDLITSGTILSFLKSPPPITLPALALAIDK